MRSSSSHWWVLRVGDCGSAGVAPARTALGARIVAYADDFREPCSKSRDGMVGGRSPIIG